jgi:hypothetical protein
MASKKTGPGQARQPESESGRFVDFARKIVSVPKQEIDKKQAEYHKRRIKEREAAREPQDRKA